VQPFVFVGHAPGLSGDGFPQNITNSSSTV
jgi:hypothetical protein